MQSQQAWKDKLAFLNRNYIIITLSNAIYTFALTLALVQLALHGTTTLGMTMTLFGLVATANSVVVLAMRPFAGFLASRSTCGSSTSSPWRSWPSPTCCSGSARRSSSSSSAKSCVASHSAPSAPSCR
ncbi:hypothetical protein [Bifidobacterium breve]|uniref:hypothetical protein n=1 Tax=Bifidobacterium breve TaxID=1685 RepID=UPI001F4CBD78|nr:hypothetical protein [Bifidobacterium breve]